jgi:cyclophilin family peptidyl-prolyl cis-trans isomerase
MLDRAWIGAPRRTSRGAHRPRVECLEGRSLLTAGIAPINGTISVTQGLGTQVPLNGTVGGATQQSFSVQSSNTDIQATAAQGDFLTLTVTHTAANSSDVSFGGTMTFQLFNDLTPNTVATIESIVNSGFYVNTANQLFRVASGFPDASHFIIQGGSINNNGTGSSGQPGTPFADEYNTQLVFSGAGQLAMANAGADTNDSQFFITTGSPTSLNFSHAIFGQLVADPNNILTQMTQVATTTNSNLVFNGQPEKSLPINPITITAAAISKTGPNGTIHINAANASAGETSTITVTATDPSTNTTATQTFPVTVVAQTQTERPFLNNLPGTQTVATVATNTSNGTAQPTPVFQQTVGLNQPDIFLIPAVNPTPGTTINYVVEGGVSTTSSGSTFVSTIQNATATVDQKTGVVTVTPNQGFSGTINFLVGVGAGSAPATPSPSNYNFHWVQLTVNSSSANVNLPPIALPATQSVKVNTPTTIQLQGNTANPKTGQTLQFALVTQPTHGTVSNFNPQTGALTYTPASDFAGNDSLQFQVSAVGSGASNPPLTSNVATVNITVANASTGAVRLINDVLLVTPRPRTDKKGNTIVLNQIADPTTPGGSLVQVTINGVVDAEEPSTSSLVQIVVFGAKTKDTIIVSPNLDGAIPVTLDGGHGGKNVLVGGAGPTREHGWFGHNVLVGGTGPNELIGRAGRVVFRPSTATRTIFAGVPHPGPRHFNSPPGGTFFKFKNGRLIPVPTPPVQLARVSQKTRTG